MKGQARGDNLALAIDQRLAGNINVWHGGQSVVSWLLIGAGFVAGKLEGVGEEFVFR